MKYSLPKNHSLSDSIISSLVFKGEDGQLALSDAQYASLEAGIGRGESLLVTSPTSTGKTQIALWAIARSLEERGNTVYLVTHKALAKQKFEDFRSQLLSPFMDNDTSELVIATGDYVEDGDGHIPKEPLRSPLLVATYEKYLAMLSASGIPGDLRTTTIICDEIQLIGDKHRGQHVEVLLALLRNAGWKQFVGLSAVLEHRDAQELADWLGVKLVVQHTREKHLNYECWTPNGIAVANSGAPDNIDEGLPLPDGIELDTLGILQSLLKTEKPPLPIIVFCMAKRDTYELSRRFLDMHKPPKGQLLLPFDDLPETSANILLSETMSHRVGIHNADLTDEERHIVEQHLLEGKLDIVFATSTLAAGVNFPLGAAIFASWKRWNSARRCYEPIESSEFHNMAGRVGRMGFDHKQGRVIFIAKNYDIRIARQYLNLGELPVLKSRITPERFNQLALQLIGAGICKHKQDAETIICSTLSAQREEEYNTEAFSQWPQRLSDAIDELLEQGLIIQDSSGRLSATPVGKAIGQSGLLPETGVFLLDYAAQRSELFIRCLPTADNLGDIDCLSFLLYSACFSSPEFQGYRGKAPSRFIPYPLGRECLCNPDIYQNELVEPVWQANVAPLNAAKFCCEWMEGAEYRQLEQACPDLRAGMIRDMNQNLVWVLQGLASIITAATDIRVHERCRPTVMQKCKVKLEVLARLPRVIRRLSFRVAEGLPEDVLWMKSLNSYGSEFRLTRTEILSLREQAYTTPQKIMLGSSDADKVRINVFQKAKPKPQAKANWLRDTCRNWKISQQKKTAERHLKRARHFADVKLIKDYYNTKGTAFENAFENILIALKIQYERLDDKTKTGAPDYLIGLQDSPLLILEIKSKEGDNLVDYNKATEVLAASEIHGHKDKFCVTLCHPGVDPSVPIIIAMCGRLSVVESTDLGEALLRVFEGSLSQKQLWQWLSSPGQAIATDLPISEYI